jgi:phage regulator Rha-like protein
MSTMIAVVEAGTGVSMSSREIAELTGKRHDHVLRDIRSLLSSSLYEGNQEDYTPEKLLVNQQPPNLGSAVSAIQYGVNNANQPVYEYTLDKDHTLTLLTGYDAKARMKVIRRWQELETQASRQLRFPRRHRTTGRACAMIWLHPTIR